MQLPEAVGPFTCAAIVGAGGKTSTMFRLARALQRPVIVAHSAHLSLSQIGLADHSYGVDNAGGLPVFSQGLPEGVTLFYGPRLEGRDRVRGLDEPTLEALRQKAGRFGAPLIIEADGARGLALKAPAEHEPPIPIFADCVIVCVGLSGLGQKLDEAHVFRPEIFGQLGGLELGQGVDEAALARVITSPVGGLRNIPAAARRLVLLNQADTPTLRERAARLARILLPDYSGVVTAALHGPGPEGSAEVFAAHRPVAGIVLAAGASRRMAGNRPKQLLEWHGEALVRRAARAAMEGGLSPVVVVTGSAAEQVEAALEGLPVITAHCDYWEAGQSASLKHGLRRALELRPDLDGAAFLLSDQPFVGAEVVRAVVDLRARTLAPACAPSVGGRRCNPVLFGRELFGRLMKLEGDQGGRQILVQVETVEWDDERLGEDIDSADDYGRLRGYEEGADR